MRAVFFYAQQKQQNKQVRKIPDFLGTTSSSTNQSSLTCVCVTGRLSSRIRFPNCGLGSEIEILVLATVVGALTSAGYWMGSGRATNTNTQQGIIEILQYITTPAYTVKWHSGCPY